MSTPTIESRLDSIEKRLCELENKEIDIPKPIIKSFSERYFFLDNFYKKDILIDGETWPTIEHYFQASKCKSEDTESFLKILNASYPSQAKQLGRRVQLRDNWEEIKYSVMKKGVLAKFTQHQTLKEALINTNDAILIEGNFHHDNIWGNCKCANCKNINGKNWLGKILMEVRDELRSNDE